LKSILTKDPDIHIDNLKPNLHGYHVSGVIPERNKIHVNQEIIHGIEQAKEHSEGYYTYVFMLLATLAHEYAHWLRTPITPDEETSAAVAYSHAREEHQKVKARVVMLPKFPYSMDSFSAIDPHQAPTKIFAWLTDGM
jgi:hypothetical protein